MQRAGSRASGGFLSTPSARRATPGLCPDAQAGRISIHALREEGDQKGEPITIPLNDFYPRPPRGGRPSASPSTARRSGFLSTPSARRATSELPQLALVGAISIHALREKGDVRLSVPRICEVDFYPRPPRGGRLPTRQEKEAEAKFLSTPSARRATAAAARATARPANFYPRPPRGGRPAVRTKKSLPRRHFYPRPPRGGRHADLENPTQAPMISIHALREEGDPSSPSMQRRHHYFYPRPPRGGRPPTARHSPGLGTISIHALREEGDRALTTCRACP